MLNKFKFDLKALCKQIKSHFPTQWSRRILKPDLVQSDLED